MQLEAIFQLTDEVAEFIYQRRASCPPRVTRTVSLRTGYDYFDVYEESGRIIDTHNAGSSARLAQGEEGQCYLAPVVPR